MTNVWDLQNLSYIRMIFSFVIPYEIIISAIRLHCLPLAGTFFLPYLLCLCINVGEVHTIIPNCDFFSPCSCIHLYSIYQQLVHYGVD